MSDLDVRQQALDPGASFIVQAPAGSGKTALLVYRFLAALATVERPEQVLAITFTRKATAEMRERILDLLQQAEANAKANDDFEQQGIDLAKNVLARDQQYAWQLLDVPSQLQVLTIDAFCTRLSGDMPWLSRLGDKPSTSDDATHLYEAAVGALLASLLDAEHNDAHKALKTVLNELDFDYARCRRLFVAMLGKRDQWLRHLVRNDIAELRHKLQASWGTLIQDCLNTLTQTISANALGQLLEHANISANLIPDGKPQLDSFKAVPVTQPQQLTLGHWRDLQHLLTTSEAKSFRARLDKNIGFPADQKPRKEAMLTLLQECAESSTLLDTLQQLNILPNPEYSDHDWQQLLALEKVLLQLAALLQLEFRNASQCDHSEVTQRALRALADLDSPTDLALRIDYQLSHILVDEFQDTSRSQLELLRQLSAGWQAGDGRSLFLVGDPMQSIYRFREADVGLFLQVTNNAASNVFDTINIQPLKLEQNFRSSHALVNWFNDTFSQSFPAKPKVLTGAINYATSAAAKNPTAHDQQHIRAELVHSDGQEAQRVVHHVSRWLQTAHSSESRIAILVRSRSHLGKIIAELDKQGIAFTGLDIKPLVNVAAVQDIVSLCKAIARPHDRLIWLTLLRCPLLGLSLVELFELSHNDVWASLKQHRFSDETQQRLDRFLPLMDSALAQRQQVPLHAVTRWAWRALGGLQLQQGMSDSDIERVLEIIASLEVGGDLPSLADLDRALQGLFAQPETSAGDRVILSTIHKAKGLQYDTVILPGLDRKPRSDDKKVLMWTEDNTDSSDAALLLAPIRLHKESGQHFKYLRHLEDERARQERVRMMYVACTRAEREVVLIAQHKQNDEGEIRAPIATSLLHTVWPSLQSQFSIIDHAADATEVVAPSTQVLQRLPNSFRQRFAEPIQWQAQQEPAIASDQQPTLEYEWATELATGVGIVLHNWLEVNSSTLFSLALDEHQRQLWRAELRTLNVPENRLNSGVKRLETAVRKMQADPHAQFLFAPHAQAQNELALSRVDDGKIATFKIDRTFIDQDNQRWIVDYKTTTTQQVDVARFVDAQVAERHQAQLENYGRLMAELDPRPIQLAVYFPLLGELRSWPYKND